MAEVMVRDGTWTFDGEILRIVPGRDRSVKKLRQLLGEMAVPLEAVSGIAYEPEEGRTAAPAPAGGRRPVTQATRGRIADTATPTSSPSTPTVRAPPNTSSTRCATPW